VWERWKPTDGEPLVSCAIVTCAANAVVAPIHDRMPVIVPPAERPRCFAPECGRGRVGTAAYSESEMEAYPVSRLVNAPRNDGQCIQPGDVPGS
jgi:putative SOS response-associated peptidase YedK